MIDQIAPVDPLAAAELNAFEHSRDPSHTRALSDIDLRTLFEANGLVLKRAETVSEPRDLDAYLDLAGCEGEKRERARSCGPAELHGRTRLVPAREALGPRHFHLRLQPTAGVSRTGGSWPASTASSASRR